MSKNYLGKRMLLLHQFLYADYVKTSKFALTSNKILLISFPKKVFFKKKPCRMGMIMRTKNQLNLTDRSNSFEKPKWDPNEKWVRRSKPSQLHGIFKFWEWFLVESTFKHDLATPMNWGWTKISYKLAEHIMILILVVVATTMIAMIVIIVAVVIVMGMVEFVKWYIISHEIWP